MILSTTYDKYLLLFMIRGVVLEERGERRSLTFSHDIIKPGVYSGLAPLYPGYTLFSDRVY